MHPIQRRNLRRRRRISRDGLAVLLAALLGILPSLGARAQDASTFSPEQLEQLVAPVALYPDSLLAQVLMASTYPLEVVEAARWQEKNASLQGDALDKALQDETWDPSVKSLVSFPQVLTMMNEKLDWTQQLGDAFLAEQSGMMDAVQRLRVRAEDEGNLKTTEQQKVIVEKAPPPPPDVVQTAAAPETIIRIEPADPQVIYVPTYNPTVVYGAWPYPSYPPYSYYPPGYVAGSIFSFGVGLAVGGALWGGCNWGWGHGDIDVNVNRYNDFNRNVNRNWDSNRTRNEFRNGKWQHNPEHRKGAQYRDRSTRDRYGKGARPGVESREAFRGRAEQGRRDIARQGTRDVQRQLDRQARPGANRPGAAQRPGAGKGPAARPGAQRPSAGQRPAGGRQPAAAQRPGGNRPSSRPSSLSSASRGSGAFSSMDRGSQVRRDSSRGHSSRQSMRGGGGSRGGGGGRGGGGRGGGGGRRR